MPTQGFAKNAPMCIPLETSWQTLFDLMRLELCQTQLSLQIFLRQGEQESTIDTVAYEAIFHVANGKTRADGNCIERAGEWEHASGGRTDNTCTKSQ